MWDLLTLLLRDFTGAGPSVLATVISFPGRRGAACGLRWCGIQASGGAGAVAVGEDRSAVALPIPFRPPGWSGRGANCGVLGAASPLRRRDHGLAPCPGACRRATGCAAVAADRCRGRSRIARIGLPTSSSGLRGGPARTGDGQRCGHRCGRWLSPGRAEGGAGGRAAGWGSG